MSIGLFVGITSGITILFVVVIVLGIVLEYDTCLTTGVVGLAITLFVGWGLIAGLADWRGKTFENVEVTVAKSDSVAAIAYKDRNITVRDIATYNALTNGVNIVTIKEFRNLYNVLGGTRITIE